MFADHRVRSSSNHDSPLFGHRCWPRARQRRVYRRGQCNTYHLKARNSRVPNTTAHRSTKSVFSVIFRLPFTLSFYTQCRASLLTLNANVLLLRYIRGVYEYGRNERRVHNRSCRPSRDGFPRNTIHKIYIPHEYSRGEIRERVIEVWLYTVRPRARLACCYKVNKPVYK